MLTVYVAAMFQAYDHAEALSSLAAHLKTPGKDREQWKTERAYWFAAARFTRGIRKLEERAL